jgi:hypothetical protein
MLNAPPPLLAQRHLNAIVRGNVMPDMVNNPPHYNQGGIECIDAIKAACVGLDGFEGYLTANCLKYLWRWKHKNGIQDLQKARWYLDRLIKEYE